MKKEENKTTQVAQVERNITDRVLNQVKTFQQADSLTLPQDYNPGNALKSAFLILQETVDRNKKPVLESCTQASIANALLDLVVQGLNPAKKQAYFIAYGQKLTLMRSYMGSIALAKRVTGLQHIKAHAIFEGDEIEFSKDLDTGFTKVVKHDSKFGNQDNDILGAYAIMILKDGDIDAEVMTIKQIRSSWGKSQSKGNGNVHKEFPEEMVKRTVLNRACKLLINSSDDSNLMKDEFNEETHHDTIQKTVDENLDNAETIDIEEVEVVEVSEDEENQAMLDAENAEALKGDGQVKAKF